MKLKISKQENQVTTAKGAVTSSEDNDGAEKRTSTVTEKVNEQNENKSSTDIEKRNLEKQQKLDEEELNISTEHKGTNPITYYNPKNQNQNLMLQLSIGIQQQSIIDNMYENNTDDVSNMSTKQLTTELDSTNKNIAEEEQTSQNIDNGTDNEIRGLQNDSTWAANNLDEEKGTLCELGEESTNLDASISNETSEISSLNSDISGLNTDLNTAKTKASSAKKKADKKKRKMSKAKKFLRKALRIAFKAFCLIYGGWLVKALVVAHELHKATKSKNKHESSKDNLTTRRNNNKQQQQQQKTTVQQAQTYSNQTNAIQNRITAVRKSESARNIQNSQAYSAALQEELRNRQNQ